MEKVNNVIRIGSSLDGSFFKYWFTFLRPFHNLTDREIDIIACFARHRYLLGKVIKDSEILDRVTMSRTTLNTVMKECNIKASHFQVIMSKFKKKGVIREGKINPKFLPNIIDDKPVFKLLLLFDNEGTTTDNTESGPTA